MRIYTEVNYIWSEDEGKLIQTSSKSYEYEGELAQCWVGVAIAGVTALVGMYASWKAAQSAKESGYASGAEYDRLANETLLTRNYNIAKLQDQRFRMSTALAEDAGDKEAFIRKRGVYEASKKEVAVGSSGVQISGTGADQIIKSRLDTASNVMQNLEQLTFAQQNLVAEGEAKEESERMIAKQKYNKYKVMANMARTGADTAHFAGMMGGFTQGVNTFSNLGGFKGSENWGKEGSV